MKAFVTWLFSENNSTQQIGLFDGWHFLYLFVVFGGAVLLALYFKNKSEQAKDQVIRLFAYLTIGLYLADFFIMPLSDSYGSISEDKLPFHICTLMAVLAPFVQFNKKFLPIKDTVVTLAIASSVMWMCYPGSALGGQPPFSYVIFQTFMFHGFLFCWGFLNLALGAVRLDIHRIWREFCGILVILLWAAFGNTVYGGHNWFFIRESIFAFLPDQIMPLAVVVSVFGVCLVVYGVYYLVQNWVSRPHSRVLHAKA